MSIETDKIHELIAAYDTLGANGVQIDQQLFLDALSQLQAIDALFCKKAKRIIYVMTPGEVES